MGRTDKATQLWFPIQKMTCNCHNGEYVDCLITYLNGAKQLEQLHPEQLNIVTFSSLRQVARAGDIYSCPWSNRLPANREANRDLVEFLDCDREYIAESRTDWVEKVVSEINQLVNLPTALIRLSQAQSKEEN